MKHSPSSAATFRSTRIYSKDSAIRIDQEITRIVTSNYDRAREALQTHTSELTLIAEALLIREVLDADQVKQIARGVRLRTQRRPMPLRARPTARSSVRKTSLPR